jgi:hypothetical protein
VRRSSLPRRPRGVRQGSSQGEEAEVDGPRQPR